MSEPQMITIWPDCVECNGTGKRTVEVECEARNTNGFVDMQFDCLRCHGEGWLEVRVCAACLETEKACKCYDEEPDDLTEAERLGEERLVLR